jgi:integrase
LIHFETRLPPIPKLATKSLTDTAITKIGRPKQGSLEVADGHVRGLRLRVSCTGRKTFILGYRVNGKFTRRSLGNYPSVSLKDARALAEDIREKALGGEDLLAAGNEISSQSSNVRTFREIAEDYIATEVPRMARPAEIEARIRQDLLPEFGDRRFDQIKKIKRDVLPLLDRVERERGSGAADGLRQRIQAIANWAVKRRFELEDAEMDTSPLQSIPKTHRKKKHKRFLSDDEIRMLWAAWDKLEPPFDAFLRTLLVLGQRRGETQMIRWSDVDFRERVWTILDNKSDREHVVPLPALAVEIIESQRRVPNSPYVFTGRTGQTPISGFSKIKRRVDELCPLQTPWELKSLRKTVSTNVARLTGASDFQVGRILNHARETVTGEHYNAYEYYREKKEMLDAWADHLRMLINTPVS